MLAECLVPSLLHALTSGHGRWLVVSDRNVKRLWLLLSRVVPPARGQRRLDDGLKRCPRRTKIGVDAEYGRRPSAGEPQGETVSRAIQRLSPPSTAFCPSPSVKRGDMVSDFTATAFRRLSPVPRCTPLFLWKGRTAPYSHTPQRRYDQYSFRFLPTASNAHVAPMRAAHS